MPQSLTLLIVNGFILSSDSRKKAKKRESILLGRKKRKSLKRSKSSRKETTEDGDAEMNNDTVVKVEPADDADDGNLREI